MKKKMITGIVILIIAASGILAAVLLSSSTSLKFGFAETNIGNKWSARYLMLNGEIQKTFHVKESSAILHIDVKTTSGEISLELKGKDGEVLYQEDNLQAGSYDVKVSDDVIAVFTAKKHRGSFAAEL